MNHNKEIPVKLEKLISYSDEEEYALILSQENPRTDDYYIEKLAIIVDANQAASISIASGEISLPRPLIHDILLNLLKAVHYRVLKVVITNMINGTFHAKIYIIDEEHNVLNFDSRPSDAIALALREKAQIFVKKKVFIKYGWNNIIRYNNSMNSKDNHYQDLEEDDLIFEFQLELQKAICNENFELAAQIRDKLKNMRRKNQH
jgi:hypothetical protein